MDPIAPEVELPPGFRELARASGEPQDPGLTMVYLHPLGSPADAKQWRNIIVHQTEGPAGSAKSLALAQFENPTKRGVTVWVETDGTVYWSTAETAIPTHGDGANRNDNKYSITPRPIAPSSRQIRSVSNSSAIIRMWQSRRRANRRGPGVAGAVFAGALRHSVRERLRHNWIDYKDRRYCEGCDLASLARKLAYDRASRR